MPKPGAMPVASFHHQHAEASPILHMLRLSRTPSTLLPPLPPSVPLRELCGEPKSPPIRVYHSQWTQTNPSSDSVSITRGTSPSETSCSRLGTSALGALATVNSVSSCDTSKSMAKISPASHTSRFSRSPMRKKHPAKIARRKRVWVSEKRVFSGMKTLL